MKRSPFRTEAPGVLRSPDSLVFVDSHDLHSVANAAETSARRRARICAHADDGSNVHEMFIALRGDGYIRPHKHLRVHESTHVISGSIDLLLFSDSGTLNDSITLGAFDSGLPFYYRIPPNQFHSLVIRGDVAFIHEVIQGPRDPNGAAFAEWSPADSDPEAGKKFLLKFLKY